MNVLVFNNTCTKDAFDVSVDCVSSFFSQFFILGSQAWLVTTSVNLPKLTFLYPSFSNAFYPLRHLGFGTQIVVVYTAGRESVGGLERMSLGVGW